MNLTGMQWLYSVIIGLAIGWILPAAMKEKSVMPYSKAITWGIVGSLVGALIYGLADDMPTNGMVVLWSIVASLVCYFIVRAVNNKNSANNQRTKVWFLNCLIIRCWRFGLSYASIFLFENFNLGYIYNVIILTYFITKFL